MNNKKIAFHNGNHPFLKRWTEFCDKNETPYYFVNGLSNDLLKDLEEASCFLWGWSHNDPVSLEFTRSIIKSIELKGIKVYPSLNTCWHFDDKVVQKYLFESLNLPIPKTWVFFQKDEALQFLAKTDYPLVFKLRRGAGSLNVKLVKNKSEGTKLVNQMFGNGIIPVTSVFTDVRTKVSKIKNKREFYQKLKRLPKTLKSNFHLRSNFSPDKNYILFQQFIPNQLCDYRLTVIGNRAFAFIREVRKNDFRASGSGTITYDPTQIDLKLVTRAFEIAEKIQSQSLCMDFVFDSDKNPLLIEVSYSFFAEAVYNCTGYWDKNLHWHEGHFHPEDCILEDLI